MKRIFKNWFFILLVLIGLVLILHFGNKKISHIPLPQVQKLDRTSSSLYVESAFNYSFGLKKTNSSVVPNNLAEAIDRGQKLRLKLPEHEPLDFGFRDFDLFTPQYKTSIGKNGLLDSQVRVFEGLAVDQIGEVHRATLVLVGASLAGTVRMADGSFTELYGADGESILALDRELNQSKFLCVSDPRTGESRTLALDPEILLPDWSSASEVSLDPVDSFTMLASSGIDPVTGDQTLALNAPANPQQYESSLKVATTVVVLDKAATGINTKKNLTIITSQYLALMANVAALYENQLGIRLLIQEMILTPDSSDFEDIPFEDNGETLKEFASWIQRWRPESTFGQSASIKFGAGLSDGTLGIAYLNSIHTRNGVGVLRPDFGWALPSHEMGHIFGADHSLGGVMNAQYNNSSRSFFKDLEGQQITAAKQIYDRSRNKLSGPAIMRNPAEMPFANDDVFWCAVGEEISCDILSNDMEQVYRGQENNLTLLEVGQVTPRYAGSVSFEDGLVVFRPSSSFMGTAWFSYSLKGDVGGGWLHKGDVAVVVGDLGSDMYEIDLSPGQAKTLKLNGDGIISQLSSPKQATMHESNSDSDVYIIRVNSDAAGSDRIQYRAGNKKYTVNINYINNFPLAEPDRFTLRAGETIHFNPLVNDWATGLRGAFKTDPVVAVGTNGEGRIGQEFLSGEFRMVSARSKASRLGYLTVNRSPVTKNGLRRNDPNGLLSFQAKENASGSGTIEYIIEDAIGQRSTGTITIYISGEIDAYIDSSNYVKGWVPISDQDDKNWTQINFNDDSWKRGVNGAGYERSSGYQSLISSMLNFRSEMYNENESLYLRYSFDVDKPQLIDTMTLRMKFDDGFIAFLNGKRIAAANAPMNARWNSGATALHNDQLALEFKSFDVSSHINKLLDGKNVLSIHGLNYGATSSDMLILSELIYTNKNNSDLLFPICDPPSERTSQSVILNGRLKNHKSKMTEAFFVWGKTDGGSDRDNWNYQAQIKSNISGECHYQVDGLSAEEVLFYRLYVNGEDGLIWSNDTHRTLTLAQSVIVAMPDYFTIPIGTELRINSIGKGVLANDVGIANDSNAKILKQPSHGKLNINSNGSFSYVPDEEFNGVDYFLYRLNGDSNSIDSEALKKTIVSVGKDWMYYDQAIAPDRNWLKMSFDDSEWSQGKGLLGYGNGNEATEISFGTNPNRKNVTAYFRQSFQILDKLFIDKVIFKLLRDDAAAIYLNGKEIFRDKNLSQSARYTTTALSSIVDETAYASFEIDGSLLLEGENVIAAEVHQASRTSSDLSFALIGQAYLIPGSRATITVGPAQKDTLSISYNVTENLISLNFPSKMTKNYILESSEDLINWKKVKVIDRNDNVGNFNIINDFNQQNRFFRLID